ncbi:medium-chain acyl-CoA ligase ACSF2, mitochondrial-like isoform X1 [Schistocerca nitens]|uniref:medium-chain acyl-CoA ligase ACSF2, mitochondrial-like isoform X1 n=1 Tax=Schistocerca nitens TaxID=7011 RepID=UPI0021179265|nr:medium-chain acyl-CoA ligase ACSF2, mitochondrial-like isoform X1 [Schistocerca nitens]
MPVVTKRKIYHALAVCYRQLSAPPPSYWHQPSADPLLAVTVGQLVDSAADRFGPREALVSCHQGVRLTFSEVKRRVDRLAAGLLDAGLRRGDRLALWGGNSAEWYLAALAAGRAGMVLVCANPAYEVAEFRYCLKKVGARGVVAAEACYPKVLRMAPQLSHSPPGDLQCADVPDLATVVFMEGERKRGAFQLRELMDSATRGSLGVITNQQLSIQPDDGCNILFTSGTTAKPKAAILTHHNIINNSYFVGKRMQFDEKHHRICLQVPLFHCYGFCSGVLAALHHGATVVLPSLYFNTKASLDAIEKEKCTVVYGTPTMYVDLVAERDFEDRRFENLEAAVSSGSPISHPLFLELKRKFGVRKVGSLYSLTETSSVVFQSQPTDSEDQMLNTVGAVSQHVEVKVVDEQRKVVPMGTVGELCVRGYVTVARYWSDEESTRRLYYRERWLRTGDLFIMREDGYGKLVGHLRDRIIRDGENIFPKEIQELLETHPDILETQVFGVPHERWGQQICACIRLKRGSTLTSDAVREFASGKISDFKIPSIIEIVDELPRNPSGKIQTLQLREAVMEKYGIKDVAIYGW